MDVPCTGCDALDRCLPEEAATCSKLGMWAFKAANNHREIAELLRSPKIVRGWHECPVCKKRIPSERGYKIHVSRVHGMKICRS